MKFFQDSFGIERGQKYLDIAYMDSIADNSCFLVPVVAGALVALDQHLTAFSESDFHHQILLLELRIFSKIFKESKKFLESGKFNNSDINSKFEKF